METSIECIVSLFDKGKGSPYLIRALGPELIPCLGSQPVDDIVTYLVVGCNLLLGLRLPSQPLASTKLYCLVTEAHVCEQLVQSHYAIMQRSSVESITSRS